MIYQIKNIFSSIPFIKSLYHEQTICLMLHHMAPLEPTRIPENENLKVDPTYLEEFIIEAKKHKIKE